MEKNKTQSEEEIQTFQFHMRKQELLKTELKQLSTTTSYISNCPGFFTGVRWRTRSRFFKGFCV